jgi:hypothetical protein
MIDSHFNNHGGDDLQEEARATAIGPTEHQQYADGLRQLANWYEAHPEIPLPLLEVNNYAVDSKDEAGALAKALGTFKKRYTDDLLIVNKMFGSINVQFFFTREKVCTARVVGKKYEPEVVIPARIIPGREVDVIEWDCHALNVTKDESNG